ncbi:hypothetical protein CNEO_260089 [Clostridium neonatale]|nr:hypothetical protein CNEO_260089 [Clostridium neonatale]
MIIYFVIMCLETSTCEYKEGEKNNEITT